MMCSTSNVLEQSEIILLERERGGGGVGCVCVCVWGGGLMYMDVSVGLKG